MPHVQSSVMTFVKYDDDACELGRLTKTFEASGGNIPALVVDIVASPYFTNRRRLR